MTHKEINKKYKDIQKKRAAQIRELKVSNKEVQRKNFGSYDWRLRGKLDDLKSEFRHYHIAICLLKGKTYEQIEPKTREGNEPNFKYVEIIQKEITSQIQDNMGETRNAA